MVDLTLGVEPIKLNVPLPPWHRIRNALRREDPLTRIHVAPNVARLFVDRPDEGSAEVSLWLANFSKRTLVPDRFELDSWSWLSHVLPDLPVVVRGLAIPVPARSMASLQLAVQLNAAAIRRIVEASPARAGQAIGVNWGFHLDGTLFFRSLKRPFGCTLQIPSPQVQFYWYREYDGRDSRS